MKNKIVTHVERDENGDITFRKFIGVILDDDGVLIDAQSHYHEGVLLALTKEQLDELITMLQKFQKMLS